MVRGALFLLALVVGGCGFRLDRTDGNTPDAGASDLARDEGMADLPAAADLAGMPESDLAAADLTTPDLTIGDLAGADLTVADLMIADLLSVDLRPPDGWTRSTSGVTDDLYAVAGAAGDVFAVGSGGRIVHTTDHGRTFSTVLNPRGMAPLQAAWQVPGQSDAYIVGELASVLHAAQGGGGPYASQDMVPHLGFDLTGLWGSSAADLYAVGYNRASGQSEYGVLHSTGDGTWSDVSPIPPDVTAKAYAVWGSGAGDVYVVGDKSTILHATGNPTAWTPQPTSGTVAYYGIWGSGASDVYVVGAGGTILHSTGNAAWSPQSSPVSTDLYAVWGSGAGDVYAVGAGGVVLHTVDGGAHWSLQSSGTWVALRGVWGVSPLDVYVVGDGGVILHKP